MAKRSALGRGADALLRNINIEKIEPNPAQIQPGAEPSGEVMINLSLIEPNKNQPRKNFDKDSLEELTNSIRQYGVLQPILVKKNGNRYEIIAGERRWRAAQAANLKEVPVVIRDYDDQKAKEISIIENIQRSDLNPIEEAMAYQSLMEEYHLTQEEVSDRVAKKRSTITNSLRLLKLSQSIQQFMAEGKITSGHARALLSIEDEQQRELIALDIMNKNLSVREVEKIAKAFSKKKKKAESPLPDTPQVNLDLFYTAYEDSMQSLLGTKVHINQKDKNKGRIEIEYYSQAELERIMDIFKSLR